MAVPVRFLAGAAILSGSITLIELHAPNNQIIWVNPREVTDVRAPQRAEHFALGSKCLIFLTNRNFVSVVESCSLVREKITAMRGPG